MTEVKIGGVPVGDGHPVFVVAEIGINHNGNLEIAKRLIDAAKEVGCQAVKFQKRTVPVVYTKEELEKPREVPADIMVRAINRGVLSRDAVQRLTESNLQKTTNGDLKWALEFTQAEYGEIDDYCRFRKIMWFASPWDEESVDFLSTFDPPCYKVAAASLTDDGLLKYIRSKNKPVVLSTGMSTPEQVDHAIGVLGKKDLVIMHCVSTYPSEADELNLLVIKTFHDKYKIPVGYSGHEKPEYGVFLSVAAVAMGASMLERHFTLKREMWGSDQKVSLEPSEFAQMIQQIRTIEKAMGDGQKHLWASEIPIMKKLRRKG